LKMASSERGIRRPDSFEPAIIEPDHKNRADQP
jgi:hypothetical protein